MSSLCQKSYVLCVVGSRMTPALRHWNIECFEKCQSKGPCKTIFSTSRTKQAMLFLFYNRSCARASVGFRKSLLKPRPRRVQSNTRSSNWWRELEKMTLPVTFVRWRAQMSSERHECALIKRKSFSGLIRLSLWINMSVNQVQKFKTNLWQELGLNI